MLTVAAHSLERFNFHYDISGSRLVLLVSVYLTIFTNAAFFGNVVEIYPLNWSNLPFLLSLVTFIALFTHFLLSLVCNRYSIKPVLIACLLISSLSAYFMDSYGVIIDDQMIDNIIKTDVNESLDLLTLKQMSYLFFLGVIPSLLVYRVNIIHPGYKGAVVAGLKTTLLPLLAMIVLLLIFSNFYTSFFRVHKPLRFYANPSYYIYSTGKYIGSLLSSDHGQLISTGLDATIPVSAKPRKLVIFVVGETARADHFSLNGYARDTNPYLAKEKVVSFDNVWSCGTSTAYSVPCMFSRYDRANYDKSKAKSTENLLDVLQRAGVNVLWLDNNSSSKGVADRVAFENYKTAELNPLCDGECRDLGMLSRLDSYIKEQPQGDLFIVMHQMGNHGPAYYKRYPDDFEAFSPNCKTSQIEECSPLEISNSYDNALRYTDYFLSRTISALKQKGKDFQTAMVYVSDHGESLGENNLYLHGLPYFIAPDSQKRVPMVLWMDQGFDNSVASMNALKNKNRNEYSHDNIFHSILGLMQVQTRAYNRELDIFAEKTANNG